jgi:hypothetical protein
LFVTFEGPDLRARRVVSIDWANFQLRSFIACKPMHRELPPFPTHFHNQLAILLFERQLAVLQIPESPYFSLTE